MFLVTVPTTWWLSGPKAPPWREPPVGAGREPPRAAGGRVVRHVGVAGRTVADQRRAGQHFDRPRGRHRQVHPVVLAADEAGQVHAVDGPGSREKPVAGVADDHVGLHRVRLVEDAGEHALRPRVRRVPPLSGDDRVVAAVQRIFLRLLVAGLEPVRADGRSSQPDMAVDGVRARGRRGWFRGRGPRATCRAFRASSTRRGPGVSTAAAPSRQCGSACRSVSLRYSAARPSRFDDPRPAAAGSPWNSPSP